jgi:hypothetical protein
MRPSRRWASAVGLSGAAIVVVCFAVAVPVFAYASRSTHTVTLPPGGRSGPTFGSSTATCPAGQRVLFGGYRYGVAGMRRTASNHWTVDSFNLPTPPPSTGQSLHVTSIAYCGHGALASKATNTRVIYKSGSVIAQCPPGAVVVGGGFATTPHSVVLPTQLERVAADRWRVSAVLFHGFTKHTALTAIAYCQPGPAPKLVSTTRSSDGTARATCPVGKKLTVGGMVTQSSPGSAWIVETLRAETQSTWSVTGVRPSGGTLTALAYCR